MAFAQHSQTFLIFCFAFPVLWELVARAVRSGHRRSAGTKTGTIGNQGRQSGKSISQGYDLDLNPRWA